MVVSVRVLFEGDQIDLLKNDENSTGPLNKEKKKTTKSKNPTTKAKAKQL